MLAEIKANEKRKQQKAASGADALTFFVLSVLKKDKFPNAETASRKVSTAFTKFPNWRGSEAEMREARKRATIALCAEEDDLDRLAIVVERLFAILMQHVKR